MNTKILGSVAIALSLVLSLVAVSKHTQPVSAPSTQNFGGTSPDFASAYINYGGVNHWAFKQPMKQATTTLCAVQSPVATSTLSSFSVNFSGSAASYLTSYELAEQSGPSATTSSSNAIVVSYDVLANAVPVFTATSTITSVKPDGIIPPNSWIVLDLSTSTAASVSPTFAPVGNCIGAFKEVQ